MLAKVKSLTVWGIDGYPVDVEVDISHGLPSISVVGLPDQAVKESRDRIRPAIKNSGFDFPSNRKTVINLAPADTKKEGPYFDLPIAVGILIATENLPANAAEEFSFVGELALDGSLRPVKGILPMAMELAKTAGKKIILPEQNGPEASLIKGIEAYPVKNLRECCEFLTGKMEIRPAVCDIQQLFASKGRHSLDFKDVKGQAYAKRAIEVAVAGGHNILMLGSPGAGKTMLASRIPSILPSLTLPEALEITRIHSVAGTLVKEGFVTERPYRSPHHTISNIALIGGGSIPRPGEVSLAHNGVLFLDELPEFHRDVLEVLRQPLEDGKVSISRAKGRLTFPSRFLLVGSMNPCPCGWYGDSARQCRCTLGQMLKYRRKISGPLLDRIDIHVDVSSLPPNLLMKEQDEEPSENIRQRVEAAREIQQKRFEGTGIFFNGHMNSSQLKKHCALDDECRMLVRGALDALYLSARAYDKIRKVARTIADMENSEAIKPQHLA
ncbi:MAG TPA: YifB family Mg chelatase-like AAA ATPase, partial [bacterium]|nr:YifB family Mg chelatase-like AAA ATPase [bacterium]